IHKILSYSIEGKMMSAKTVGEKSLFLTLAQISLGIALLGLSSHLALNSSRYLEALNQNDLNQYHAFSLLVCLSFISGVFLIAQHVLTQDRDQVDEEFEKAISY
ncbi:MAG: hypothetical protein B7Y67_11760, partial [Polynucleobacter sp. 35-46-11]|uniref:hypothetical protein n=2 Tax=unclassified Polynucleobacter TaxID=2640945 RepID=UPI000BCE1F21